ncbi:hypothetical protein AVEN_11135-1 [Araneus ventricosus]|uniref:Uncharacterized protein n=1 Tax=Araneus ventricosus TaxID=182803 RepID=A0A4Y2U5V4_ARAVE|nr:hypothetical protein AVEN_11135-1 [Araneus ventricosus]
MPPCPVPLCFGSQSDQTLYLTLHDPLIQLIPQDLWQSDHLTFSCLSAIVFWKSGDDQTLFNALDPLVGVPPRSAEQLILPYISVPPHQPLCFFGSQERPNTYLTYADHSSG